MKFNALATSAAVLGLLSSTGSAMAPLNTGAKPIPSRYIVVFKAGVDPEAHVSALRKVMEQDGPKNQILHQYSIQRFKGYSIRCSPKVLEFIRSADDFVEYVDEDQFVAYLGIQRNPPSWGLDRVSQEDLPLDKTYNYPDSAGEGVNMYTIDTGVYIEHEDFGGRAKWGYNAVAGTGDDDKNGHGTHCSGTMAGTTYGVAKKANVFAVKVLNDWGSGSWSDVIEGVNWVAAQHNEDTKTVANMSLGGGLTQSVNAACDAAVEKGVHIAVASGNNSGDACFTSPASAEKVVAVSATDMNDKIASFSNHGPCVEIFAPGVAITSSWVGGPDATNTISGTSMASPHVAGVMALYLAEGIEPSVANLQGAATKDVITGVPSNTVNYLLYSHSSYSNSTMRG